MLQAQGRAKRTPKPRVFDQSDTTILQSDFTKFLSSSHLSLDITEGTVSETAFGAALDGLTEKSCVLIVVIGWSSDFLTLIFFVVLVLGRRHLNIQLDYYSLLPFLIGLLMQSTF